MTRRKNALEPSLPPRLLAPRPQVEAELDELIESGRELLLMPISSDEDWNDVSRRAETWVDYCKEVARRRFSTSESADDFVHAPGVYMSHAPLKIRIEGLRSDIQRNLRRLASIKQRLPLIDAPTPVSAEGAPVELWIHPRLRAEIGPSIQRARASARGEDWARVTREAALFLETDIRRRTGIQTHKRQDLAAQALKPGGPLSFKADAGWQQAWMHYVMGILGAFGNPGAHMIRSHSETFAMGVVGAVSTVLDTLDATVGPPSSQ